MYRSYTKIFRIFGAMIIFLQISKDSVLFTNSENKNFSLFFFLTRTDRLTPLSMTQSNHGGATLTDWPQNAPTVTLRRDGLHQRDLHHVANLTQPSKHQPTHQMELYAGHGDSDSTAVDVAMATVQ